MNNTLLNYVSTLSFTPLDDLLSGSYEGDSGVYRCEVTVIATVSDQYFHPSIIFNDTRINITSKLLLVYLHVATII